MIGFAHYHDEENQLYTSEADWRRLMPFPRWEDVPEIDLRRPPP